LEQFLKIPAALFTRLSNPDLTFRLKLSLYNEEIGRVPQGRKTENSNDIQRELGLEDSKYVELVNFSPVLLSWILNEGF
jgi:hypothetical protein